MHHPFTGHRGSPVVSCPLRPSMNGSSTRDRAADLVRMLKRHMKAADRLKAHRTACQLRDLGWTIALPSVAATAAVLAMQLSNSAVSDEKLLRALASVEHKSFNPIHIG